MSSKKAADFLEPVKERETLKPPRKYNVILNNDDYTPMDFVVEVLTRFFNHDTDSATEIMLKVHYEGKAVCGTYPYDIAMTKTEQVNDFARSNDHPLLCSCDQA